MVLGAMACLFLFMLAVFVTDQTETSYRLTELEHKLDKLEIGMQQPVKKLDRSDD